MVEIQRLREGVADGVKIYAKLEGFNPGGSVKDRAAWNMLRRGLDEGRLAPGKTILDSTSGNTGIALAMVGAALGFPVTLVMPANVSIERKRVVTAYGATPVYSDPLEGSDGALMMCREMHEAEPDKWFKPDQYFNEANPEAHFLTTGPEIWEQTDGAITHLVASIGTGGTVIGTGRYLKSQDKAVQVIAVEPADAFHGIEGLKHMESSIVPGIFKEQELDSKIGVATDDAYDMVYEIAASEGMLVGQSSGAALSGALEVARQLDEGLLVVIFPDFGDRYLSTNLWMGWKNRKQTRKQ
jgi:cysteine synthase B